MLRVSKKQEFIGLNVSEHSAKLPWVETVESIIKIMKTGNLQGKVYEERDTEVGLVARFFNYLLEIVRQKQNQLQENNKDLRIKSEIDPLTKIMNRRALLEKLDGRNPYSNNISCAILDIDHFKKVNDTYGHNTGDIVLKELALIVSSHIRSNDLFARWGGEEFVVIINTNQLSTAESICEKLRLAVAKHTFPQVGSVSVSVGISTPKDVNSSFEDLFEKADKALYEAKRLGRNRVCSW